MLVDTRKSRIPAWILWVTGQTGLVTLAAISLDEGRAKQYRKVLASKPENIVVRVEATEVNHLLDASLDEVWWHDFQELREKIYYYMKHEDERKAIADAGTIEVLENHSFDVRVMELLDELRVRGLWPLCN